MSAIAQSSLESWLIYCALNEGRKLYISDVQFFDWVRDRQLVAHDHESLAAMSAALRPDDFARLRAKHLPTMATISPEIWPFLLKEHFE